MNKYQVLMICGFLLAAGSVSAITPEERAIIVIPQRAVKLLLEAESRAMERCDTTRIVVSLPIVNMDTKSNDITWVDGTYEETVTIKWSGACVEGKREGEGVLNWVEAHAHDTGDTKSVSQWRSEGRFVKGQRLGLWCWTQTFQITQGGKPTSDGSDGGCSVLAGHGKPLTDNYRKQADGRWRREFDEGSSTDSYLAAGTLEAQSAKILADAAAGKTDLKVALVVQSRALDDLVPGSKIVLALSTVPISLKDKRVAIVLSSQTVRELERFKRERQALIDASAGLSGKAATERAKFIQASNPNRFLISIIKLVKKYAKDAQPADDLTGLQKGDFDYALVLDWKSIKSFESVGGFLVSRDLKAVKQIFEEPSGSTKNTVMLDNSRTMEQLAEDYAARWGDDFDSVSSSGFYLYYMLQDGRL